MASLKNLIENALGVFWRWLRPKLRGKTFFSLAELNRFGERRKAKPPVLKLKMHTVILLVGPSGCGKSYLSKQILMPALREQLKAHLPYANVQYISSDELRRDLLGDEDVNYGRYTHDMMAVSEQAFDLLHRKLSLVTSYPVNAPIVIVDTTGLNQAFRNKITTAARDANYNTCCVLFTYKDRDDYYRYLGDLHDKSVVSAQLKRFNQTTLSEIRKRDFDTILYIKNKDFAEIDVQLEDVKEYAEHYLETHLEYNIIGDLHGCYDELLDLLGQLSFEVSDGVITKAPSGKKILLLGDYIDGELEGVEKVINFIHTNKKHFILVAGNHENFVYRYHKKDLATKSLPPQDIIDSYFPTTKLLESNEELAKKFCELKEASKEFYFGRNFIVTHSPCEEKALGKRHTAALRSQRNYRYPHRNENESIEEYSSRFEEALSFIEKSAATNKPFHIFGHCKVKNVARVKNKIGIDTGCRQGNRLTAITIVGNKTFFTSTPSLQKQVEELPLLFTRKDAATEILEDVDLSLLDAKEMNRIRRSSKNKINYISGTMSPANKDTEENKLESMSMALSYYRSMGVERVCLQPKYMGSRAELFLNCLDVTKSYTSTRRGYLIDRVDLTDAYQKVLNRLKPFAEENNFEWLYLDCELMPWFALGSGLIESQYLPVKEGIESENKFLRDTGFEQALSAFREEYENSGYAKLSNQLTKEDLRKALTPHKCAGYEAFSNVKWISLDVQDVFLSVYKRQLEVFASPSEVHFKPFSLLKAIRPDESEQLFFNMNNSEQFNLLSEDECLVVDLTDTDALKKAEGFFDSIVSRELEGVVVKPESPYIKGVAPFLKVRSPLYLSIIYGYDYLYPPKYEKLIRQKKVQNKMKTSIDEYAYGKRMLEIPRNTISDKNKEYVNLFARLIFEEKKEEKFDPRL